MDLYFHQTHDNLSFEDDIKEGLYFISMCIFSNCAHNEWIQQHFIKLLILTAMVIGYKSSYRIDVYIEHFQYFTLKLFSVYLLGLIMAYLRINGSVELILSCVGYTLMVPSHNVRKSLM
ncbi:MAG: hypothetical protein R3Y57_02290 [Erysipelotrichaceae bacterium]